MDKKPYLVPVKYDSSTMTYNAKREELPKNNTKIKIYKPEPPNPLGKGESFKDSDIETYKENLENVKFFVDMRTVRDLTPHEEFMADFQEYARAEKMKKPYSSNTSLSKGGKKSRRRTNRKSNKKRRNKSKRL